MTKPLALSEIDPFLAPAATFAGIVATVTDAAKIRAELIDRLVWTAVFAPDAATRDEARSRIRSIAEALGIFPWSIAELYTAMGRGEAAGFTTPAINIRAMAYDSARAAIRAAVKKDAGALIFEIARSEIGYTDQRPAEYATVMMAAAIREGWRGPLFIQGDHFQTNAKKFKADPTKELEAITGLIDEAMPAGFLNIDIDTSTLVDLSKGTLEEQQKANGENCAFITKHIRTHEPKGVSVSVGGEIGEVGKTNSSPEEFRAYMSVYLASLPKGMAGISKVSIQTGTSHGGVPLPDGTVAKVNIDFDCIRKISEVARKEYGLSGAVQHGASTLPADAFHHFPDATASEVHLATEFQNMVYENPALPAALKAEMYEWCRANCADERKEGDTEDQFLYKARKKAIGPFKEKLWSLPEDVRGAIGGALEAKFAFLFDQLKIGGTRAIVDRFVKPSPLPRAGSGKASFVRDDEAGD
jgi:fructose/tagatose bisphosphate aldolase